MAHKISRARWFFDRTSWTPKIDDLTLALSSVQSTEKERILKYVFFKDAVGTLSGRLMMRKFICGATGLPWDQLTISRNEQEKPYFASDSLIQFNVSHQGKYTVLAGETGNVNIGVDVMEMKYTGGKPLQEFFRVMYRQLTDQEWEAVKLSSLESQQIKTFYRIWCLKESYVKATGTGLSLPLRSLNFKFNSKLKNVGQYVEDTEVFLDGQKQDQWRFQEILLDDEYCACVAINCSADELGIYPCLPFSQLYFKDLKDTCRAIIPSDEVGAQELLNKFENEHNCN